MRPPIRILFVLSDLQGGGAERTVLDLLRNFDSSKYACTLFLLSREGTYWQEVPRGIQVVSVGTKGRLRYRLPTVMAKLLPQAIKARVIVGALELEPTYLAFTAGRLARRPVIGWVHTTMDQHLQHVPAWHEAPVRRVYPRLQHVVFPSQGSAEALTRLVGLRRERTRVVPNVIDHSRIARAASEPVPDWASPIFRRPVVLGMGRLQDQKGFDLLITAHARLIARGLDHNLLILGDGPRRGALAALASALRVERSVFLPGFIANPYPLLRAAKAFALSSRYEGLPMAILEALVLGTPIVAANCPSGPAEILGGQECGLLVPPEDAQALSEAVGTLLADETLRRSLSEKGLRRARAFFPDRVIPSWDLLLHEVINP